MFAFFFCTKTYFKGRFEFTCFFRYSSGTRSDSSSVYNRTGFPRLVRKHYRNRHSDWTFSQRTRTLRIKERKIKTRYLRTQKCMFFCRLLFWYTPIYSFGCVHNSEYVNYNRTSYRHSIDTIRRLDYLHLNV